MIKLWTLIVGTKGIILFVRLVHLLLRGLAAAAVAVSLRRFLATPLAVAASLFTFAVVPFDLPSVSYNTLGSLCLTAGCFLGLKGRQIRESLARAGAAGALHAIASIAYPPLALAAAVFFSVRLILARERARFAIAYISAALLPATIVAALVARGGYRSFLNSFAYAAIIRGREPFATRLTSMLASLWSWHPPVWAMAGVMLFLLVGASRRFRGAVWFVPLVPLVAQWNRMPVLYATLGFVAWLALIGTVVSLGMLRDEAVRTLWFQVVVPGLVASLTTALFSSNKEIGFGVGALPAAQAIVAILAIVGGGYFESANAKNAMIVAATVTLCWLIPSAQQYRPGGVYRDDDVWQLDALVDHGPFAGLRTTSLKLTYLNQLQSDLDAVRRPGGRVMFFYNFPAGYLMTSMLPAPPSVWTLPGAAARRGDHLPYFFDERSRWPDVAVRMVRVPYMNKISATYDYSPGDPLNDAFASYALVIVRDDYQVMVRR